MTDSYGSIPGAHYSTLKIMGDKSPRHFDAAERTPHESTEDQLVGTATHWAILEPKKFRERIRIWPEENGPRRGSAWTRLQVEAQTSRLIILTEAQHDHVIALARAVRSSPQVAPFLEDPKGIPELGIHWTDPETGLKCKAKLDWVCRVILDLKTTRDASPEGFGRECAKYGYHKQAGFYSDGAKHAGLGDLPFAFVAIEKEPPFVVQVYNVVGDVLELGRAEMQANLRRLAELQKIPRDQWPGYSDGPLELALPRWAMPYQENNLASLGLDLEGVDTDTEEESRK